MRITSSRTRLSSFSLRDTVADVHRSKTRFAARINRVAGGLERRGVGATYKLHERLLSNRSSRRRFDRERPVLDDVQKQIVSDLDREGCSVVRFEDFLGRAAWEKIDAQGAEFVARTDRALAAGDTSIKVHRGKEFLVRLHSRGVDLGLDDPWLDACVTRRMLDVANTYVGLWTKLEYVDLWYAVPQPEQAERVASQRWHRDYNDRRLVKTFLYLVDVDEHTGPFEYVPGSAAEGPYSAVWPWAPYMDAHSQEEFAELVPDAAVRTFTGSKGTLIFCDTSGFHRGGRSTTDPRVLATATYLSPASLSSLTVRNFRFTGAVDELDGATRYALT